MRRWRVVMLGLGLWLVFVGFPFGLLYLLFRSMWGRFADWATTQPSFENMPD